MKASLFSLLCGILLIGSLPSWLCAEAAVGDDFQIQFRAVDGTRINTAAFRGKLLIVDFWATWCHPCMEMVPHMVELNQKYASKGLQIIGISRDDDQGALVRVTREKGMNWPEYFDGGAENPIVSRWAPSYIPYTILVSPEGKVLFANNPYAGLQEAVEKAFKEHPPQLVDPQIVADANSALNAIESSIAAGDEKGAIKLMSKISPDARLDPKFASREDAVQKKLEAAATSMLSEVQTQIDQAKYIDSVARLKELSTALAGLPEATRAKLMLASLMARPEVKSTIENAEKEQKASQTLEVAQKLQAQKKDELAYARFNDVVKFFPGTNSAANAQEQIDNYQKDTAFMKQMVEHAASTKATSALHMGDSYKSAGNLEMARKKYQSVINDFPGTSYAALAQKALADMASQ